MEDGLVLWYSLLLGATLSVVLILVVVEDGLVPTRQMSRELTDDES